MDVSDLHQYKSMKLIPILRHKRFSEETHTLSTLAASSIGNAKQCPNWSGGTSIFFIPSHRSRLATVQNMKQVCNCVEREFPYQGVKPYPANKAPLMGLFAKCSVSHMFLELQGGVSARTQND